jgi:hypothetical protein
MIGEEWTGRRDCKSFDRPCAKRAPKTWPQPVDGVDRSCATVPASAERPLPQDRCQTMQPSDAVMRPHMRRSDAPRLPRTDAGSAQGLARWRAESLFPSRSLRFRRGLHKAAGAPCRRNTREIFMATGPTNHPPRTYAPTARPRVSIARPKPHGGRSGKRFRSYCGIPIAVRRLRVGSSTIPTVRPDVAAVQYLGGPRENDLVTERPTSKSRSLAHGQGRQSRTETSGPSKPVARKPTAFASSSIGRFSASTLPPSSVNPCSKAWLKMCLNNTRPNP